MTRGNDKAYSVIVTYDDLGNLTRLSQVGGLTKREHFAAMAMQGLAGVDSDGARVIMEMAKERSCSPPEASAQIAVSLADALIAALNEERS